MIDTVQVGKDKIHTSVIHIKYINKDLQTVSGKGGV